MFLISLVVDRSTGDLVYFTQDTPHRQCWPEAALVSTSKQALGGVDRRQVHVSKREHRELAP